MLLASVTGACGNTRKEEEERSRHARQMRDVARMLDAMEASEPVDLATIMETPVPIPPKTTRRVATSYVRSEPHAPGGRAIAGWPFIALGGAGTGTAAMLLLAMSRRRARHARQRIVKDAPSLASHFAGRPPDPPAAQAPSPSPAWVYRRSAYETPDLHVTGQPVDLLVPPPPDAGPAIDAPMPVSHGSRGDLRERLSATDTLATLHLVGDERFPDIRCSGKAIGAEQAWEDILVAQAHHDDEDARLARWLLPALRMHRARDLPRRDAERLLIGIEEDTARALDGMDSDEQPHGFARWIRFRLACIERLSGANRLFASRDLLTRLARDPRCDHPLALDACIDAQLAWASWLLGAAAAKRLDEAERYCDRLAAIGPDAATRALRRRGETWLHRANARKPAERLPDLERAQSLLDDAHARGAEAETALLVARTAQQRARLLTAEEAAAACSHALLHAFLAEHDPAWRVDALACRLDIQLTYEALPEHATEASVTAALGRSLEAAGPLPASARTAVAEARLRGGDHAGAAAWCEAICRTDAPDDRVVRLWRDACRRWADDRDHDTAALAQSLRHLAIARSTL
ncbi:hypothetical protein J2T07_000942 [Luteibacter jiangsuensis]|uniref:Uncharacterized protein n=1 Tax=Luteibacter jiangsuensis TaxID=637577 RepID=A0ABT9SWU3_9GAMM|nr:hypothetical protein [Luteibacter jiangsuensis]